MMICPMLMTGIETIRRSLTQDEYEGRRQCRMDQCAWWMTDVERCAVAVLARPAELADIARKREPG
jgi:hypothetical protein